jgi:hypothetical protein
MRIPLVDNLFQEDDIELGPAAKPSCCKNTMFSP